MPAVASGKVLVTGANGFIAAWIIKLLLEQGFSVRGTVRSLAKGDSIRDAMSVNTDKLEFVVVEDITVPGAFDEALKGIDAVVHPASPVTIVADDPDELIRPALLGTTSLLHSASAPGSSVQRIVIVSSLAAVVDTSRPTPAVFTEDDWNEFDVATVRAQGAAAPQPAKYKTSKTLAEKAAWDLFREGKEKGTIGWDLVTLCPPWVFGPQLGARDAQELGSSIGTWFKLVVKEEGEIPTWSRTSWVDVRDFAEATFRVLTRPEAGGERFIISNEPYIWEQWIALGRRLLGKPNAEPPSENIAFDTVFDSTKSQKVLGMQYRPKEETATDLIQDFKLKGWC